jgi:hypothetical protein
MMPPAFTHSDATGTAPSSSNASAPVKSVKLHTLRQSDIALYKAVGESVRPDMKDFLTSPVRQWIEAKQSYCRLCAQLRQC